MHAGRSQYALEIGQVSRYPGTTDEKLLIFNKRRTSYTSGLLITSAQIIVILRGFELTAWLRRQTRSYNLSLDVASKDFTLLLEQAMH